MYCPMMSGNSMMTWMMGLPMAIWTIVGVMLIVLLAFAIRKFARG
jgi:hypothetical protein